MSKLWVKVGNWANQVCTEDCYNVYDFLEVCKMELSYKLCSYDADQLSLSTTEDGSPLRPGLNLADISSQPGYSENDHDHPLFIIVAAKNVDMLSMVYGKASMQFITEATGVESFGYFWKNIPVDKCIEASPEFVELFKKHCSVIDSLANKSRRTTIELFLREIVAQFPDFIIFYDYRMTLENEAKKRRLNGNCDYTICHRGQRCSPHLVIMQTEIASVESFLQCSAACASIRYRKTEAGLSNVEVYGIISSGSNWRFIIIRENGYLSVSIEYLLNIRTFIKEEFDLIYRLVHYVVKQTHLNNPRIQV